MGHLFSYQDIQPNVRTTEARSDIPQLELESRVEVLRRRACSVCFARRQNRGAAVVARSSHLPAPAANGNRYSTGSAIPAAPGAVAWPDNIALSTSSSTSLPPGGLVIPEDGSQPFPAGVAPSPPSGLSIEPGPAVPYTAHQVSPPGPLGAKLVRFDKRSASRLPEIKFESRPETNDTMRDHTRWYRADHYGRSTARQQWYCH